MNFIQGSIVTLVPLAVAASAGAQVLSVQPSAPLGAADFAASARVQYGSSDLSQYIMGLLPNGQITSSQTAAVAGAPGWKFIRCLITTPSLSLPSQPPFPRRPAP